MSKSTISSWQHAFTRRFAGTRFRGTGWEGLYARLDQVSLPDAQAFWLGLELTRPGGLGYTGVFCVDAAGAVLCTSALQRRTAALEHLRTLWPGDRLRFLTDMDALRSAAARSHVFGAVVDAASPAALSLAVSLAQEIAIGNTRTALRVLSVVSPASSRPGARMAGSLPPAPAAFDVLLHARAAEPWFEHRDLAVMCAVQKDGLIGIDFTHVIGIFKESEYSGGQWLAWRLGLAGAKAVGTARGAGRAARAAKKALRGIAVNFSLAQIRSGIIDIAGDASLAEVKTAMQTIRAACPQEAQFVLGCDARGQGPFLKIHLIAVPGVPAAR